MAKKKEFNLETVKKNVFWAFLPIALLAPLITTILAVRSISAAFEQRKKTLDSTKSAVEQLGRDAAHPNQKTIDEINVKIRDLRGRVRKAWATLEKDQQARNLWPAEVGQLFFDEVKTKKWGEEISIDGRERYLNFINDYLPSLEHYVDRRRVQMRERDKISDEWSKWKEMEPDQRATPSVDTGSGGGMSGGMGMGADSFGAMDSMGTLETPLPKTELEEFRYFGKVDWASPETRTVVASWGRLPKYTEIWYAQEELWVYKALLSVIRECNQEATGPHNATVKRIQNLLIGQLAATALEMQSALRLGGGALGTDGMSTGGSTGAGGYGSGSAGGSYGGTGSDGSVSAGMEGGNMVARTEEEAARIKKTRRYVDDKGVPLLADQPAPFEQFKRMPICLRLIVDQRKIPDILVSCANCSMPIDVLWVRINPGNAKPFELSSLDPTISTGAEGVDGTASGGYGGGMSDSGMGGAGSMRGGGGSGMGGSAEGGASSGADIQLKLDGIGGPYGTNAVPIEIYGCINIFNPVAHSTQLAADSAEGILVDTEDAGSQTEVPLDTQTAAPLETQTAAPLDETTESEETVPNTPES